MQLGELAGAVACATIAAWRKCSWCPAASADFSWHTMANMRAARTRYYRSGLLGLPGSALRGATGAGVTVTS